MDNPEDRSFEISSVLTEVLNLAESNWLMLLVVTVAAAAGYTVIELSVDDSTAFSLQNLFSFVVLYLQILVIVRLAREKGLLDGRDHEDGSPTLGGYFRAFGQSILWTLGVIFGLVLLVIPGIWLMTIWFVVLPVLLVENENVMDSFGRSKALVTPHFWKILLLVLILALVYVAAAVALFLFVPYPEDYSIWTNLPLNLLLQAVQTGGWVLGLATYIQLANLTGREDLEDVFA
ncbi:MAG: hypothetical protein AAGE05_00355 [Pseudomonadota bacterium]